MSNQSKRYKKKKEKKKKDYGKQPAIKGIGRSGKMVGRLVLDGQRKNVTL